MATYNGKTIDVTITMGSRPIDTQNFEFPLVIIPHNLTDGVVDSFSTLDGVVSAGAAVNSPLYAFVSGLKGGIAPPELVKIARAEVSTITMTIANLPAVGAKVEVNCTVNGASSVVSYEVSEGDDKEAVATGLTTALTSAFTGGKNPTFASAGEVITATIAADTVKSSFGWSSLTKGYPDVVVADKTSDVLVDIATGAAQVDGDWSLN